MIIIFFYPPKPSTISFFIFMPMQLSLPTLLLFLQVQQLPYKIVASDQLHQDIEPLMPI